jgi:hypothetical protein
VKPEKNKMATQKSPAPKTDAAEAEMVWVVAVNNDMLNLFTNVWYTKDPKKVIKDDFVTGQEAAGKLQFVTP